MWHVFSITERTSKVVCKQVVASSCLSRYLNDQLLCGLDICGGTDLKPQKILMTWNSHHSCYLAVNKFSSISFQIDLVVKNATSSTIKVKVVVNFVSTSGIWEGETLRLRASVCGNYHAVWYSAAKLTGGNHCEQVARESCT